MALAGELVGVGGHFLFLGLALVSKDWRFLQRMITAPCILFLFYGSVSPFTSGLVLAIFISSIAHSPETTPHHQPPGPSEVVASRPFIQRKGFTIHSTTLPVAGPVCFWSPHGG